MKHVLGILVMAWVLAGSNGVAIPADIGREEPALSYDLALLPGPKVQVTIRFQSGEQSETALSLRPDWGGIENDGADVTELSVVDAQQRNCPVERTSPTSWIVRHAPTSSLVLSYYIPATGARSAVRGNDYRTRLSSELFQMIGNLAWLMPQRGETEVPALFRLSFSGFQEAGWEVVSSFGQGQGPFDIETTPSRFLQSIVMAGRLQVMTRTIGANPIGVAISGSEWNFRGDELADAVEQVVQTQRNFFDDHSDPWYLVTLTPNSVGPPGSMSLGGTALTNCFALYCSPNLSLDRRSPHSMRTLLLLSHEYFHNWNGLKIPTASEDPSTYWFSEGFTNFYARRQLYLAGLMSGDALAGELSQAVQAYDANPHRLAPNALIAQAFWQQREVGELPYHRGDLVALLLDEHIRHRSDGRQSLDDFMLDLFRRPIAGAPITSDVLLRRIGEWADEEVVQEIRRIVVDGAEVPLPERLTDPALELTQGQVARFDPGFDLAATNESQQLVGVREDGPAYSAGLRNGQSLQRFSFQSGQSPPRAHIVVLIDGEPTTIEYEAVGPPQPVRMYRPPQ